MIIIPQSYIELCNETAKLEEELDKAREMSQIIACLCIYPTKQVSHSMHPTAKLQASETYVKHLEVHVRHLQSTINTSEKSYDAIESLLQDAKAYEADAKAQLINASNAIKQLSVKRASQAALRIPFRTSVCSFNIIKSH